MAKRMRFISRESRTHVATSERAEVKVLKHTMNAAINVAFQETRGREID
jgi:hypothetical protein